MLYVSEFHTRTPRNGRLIDALISVDQFFGLFLLTIFVPDNPLKISLKGWISE